MGVILHPCPNPDAGLSSRRTIKKTSTSRIYWWHRRSWSTLAQVITCCSTSSSHYLDHRWLAINNIHWYTPQGNISTWILKISIPSCMWNLESQPPSAPRRQWVNIALCEKKKKTGGFSEMQAPFYQHGLTLIPAWISNYIHDIVWEALTLSIPKLKLQRLQLGNG